MTDSLPNLSPSMLTPNCPLCGGETFLAPMHKAVEKSTSVFRCRKCGVDYPVVRQGTV